ncbi:flagellar hook-length control protein FliK [Pseudomonas knackmussii]|uniref:flagellar hook-length control protein FliK n=1 Tax=Pseudomonas knackmussii TaxID=65741 RepID=UPI0013622F26|nr:flagellar hook-length control protein FliK [Pseudomonas knackmussii]
MLQVNPGLAAKATPGNDTPLPAAQPGSVPAMGRADGDRDAKDAKGAKDKVQASRDGATDATVPGDVFGAQLALQADVAQDAAQTQATGTDTPQDAQAATPTPTDTAQADPAQSAVPAAEQWLASMLGQREVTLQARDSGADASGVAQGVLKAAQAAASALPQWRSGLPAVQAMPVQPAGGQALPLAALPKEAHATPDAAPGKTDSTLDDTLRSQLDRLASQVGEPAGASPAASAPAAPAQPSTAPASMPVPERQLSLQAPAERWGEQMLDALRDNVELQLKQNQQSASIRLDPAELGRLDIHLSQEAGRLTVQIHAQQSDVARMIQQGAERLRQDIAGNGLQVVDVQVSDGRTAQQGSQQQAQQGRPAPWLEETQVRAANGEQGTPGDAERRPRDVLVTV